jgi:ribosomal protein L11 methyltransferase
VPEDRLEEVRARFIELYPEGFEEAHGEIAVYTDTVGEKRLRELFTEVSVSSIEPGWEERWREFHRPIWIGPLWVGPSWEEPPADVITVVIDPGRAFGTGSHPSTRLTLGFLVELEAGSLVDIGCGSGVLSVAAAKLGFHPVIALDREQASIETAERNAQANGVTIDVRLVDVVAEDIPSADLGLANIDLASVEGLVPRLEVAQLVTAGYFHSRMPELPGYTHLERRIDGGWAADLFQRQ